jgi:hypothetical protein
MHIQRGSGRTYAMIFVLHISLETIEAFQTGYTRSQIPKLTKVVPTHGMHM